MLASDFMLCKSKIRVCEVKKQSQVLKWGVLIHNSFLVFNKDSPSFIDHKEEAKIHLLDSKASFCQENTEFRVDILQEGKRYSFWVENYQTAWNWTNMLTLACCWTNYENFCEIQMISPWHHLLNWGVTGKLEVDLSGPNSICVMEFLRNNALIKELSIKELNSQVTILNRLLGCFPENQLKILNLSYSEISDRNLHMLGTAIKSNKVLQSLDLGFNHLTHEGIEALVNTITQMPLLEHLSVCGNIIRDQGFRVLVPKCFHYLRLKQLDCSSCGLTSESISGIKRLLKIKGLCLEHLYLQDNEFSSQAATKIFNLVRKKKARGYHLAFYLNPVKLENCTYEDLSAYKEVWVVRALTSKKELEVKPLPKLPSQSNTIKSLIEQIENLIKGSSLYVEDLVEVCRQIQSLEFQFPKNKTKTLTETLKTHMLAAIGTSDFYCLERLLECEKALGIYNPKALKTFEKLKPKVKKVVSDLQKVLDIELYTPDNLRNLNQLLDNSLSKAKKYGLKGDLVRTAELLQRKRNHFLGTK